MESVISASVLPNNAAVPCNIITGFLGSGKTTAILKLLEQKPKHERWAVLVNEFGEVGIDGSMLQHAQADEDVFIREVPGGCMCCAAGLPMHMALNMLLAKVKPHRLIIEPTGLGHPLEVIQTLHDPHYREVIDIRSTLTLVDARNINDTRYTSHETFLQQLQVADLIVATKSDVYAPDDFTKLERFLMEQSLSDKPLHQVSMGELAFQWLEQAAKVQTHSHHHHHTSEFTPLPLPGNENFPTQGYLHTENVSELFTALGWLFKPAFCFDKQKLDALLMGVEAERLKALFCTDQGFISYNLAAGVLTETAVEELTDSRIEIITDAPQDFSQFESLLTACITNY